LPLAQSLKNLPLDFLSGFSFFGTWWSTILLHFCDRLQPLNVHLFFYTPSFTGLSLPDYFMNFISLSLTYCDSVFAPSSDSDRQLCDQYYFDFILYFRSCHRLPIPSCDDVSFLEKRRVIELEKLVLS